MPKETHSSHGKTIWWGLAAALVLHLIVGVALFGRRVERPLSVPQEEAIPVKLLVSEQSQDAIVSDDAPDVPHTILRSPIPVKEEPERVSSLAPREAARETPAVVRATELFAASILADPRSRNAREGLRQLAAGERIVQLCNLEAMEQVHRWRAEFQPDFLVAYAMADTTLSGRVLRADGGALRSKGSWYNIKYRCEVSPDVARVAAFEFAVGTEIPKEEWEAHSLMADDGLAD